MQWYLIPDNNGIEAMIIDSDVVPGILEAKKLTLASNANTYPASALTSCRRGVQIKADPGNGGQVWIGNTGVGGTDYYPLFAGDDVFVPVGNPSTVILKPSTSNMIAYTLVF